LKNLVGIRVLFDIEVGQAKQFDQVEVAGVFREDLTEAFNEEGSVVNVSVKNNNLGYRRLEF
jgi:hypothetical protein